MRLDVADEHCIDAGLCCLALAAQWTRPAFVTLALADARITAAATTVVGDQCFCMI